MNGLVKMLYADGYRQKFNGLVQLVDAASK